MRFYGNGVVWDSSANKPLVKFEKPESRRNADGSNAVGFVDVEDGSIKNKLLKLGYPHDSEKEKIEPQEDRKPKAKTGPKPKVKDE